MVSKIGAGFLD